MNSRQLRWICEGWPTCELEANAGINSDLVNVLGILVDYKSCGLLFLLNGYETGAYFPPVHAGKIWSVCLGPRKDPVDTDFLFFAARTPRAAFALATLIHGSL